MIVILCLRHLCFEIGSMVSELNITSGRGIIKPRKKLFLTNSLANWIRVQGLSFDIEKIVVEIKLNANFSLA